MKMIVYILLTLTLTLTLTLASPVNTEFDQIIREEGRKVRVIGHDGKEDRALSEFLEGGLACIRNLFIEGDENSGFPSLQEIIYGDFPVDVASDANSLKADVTNFIVHNFGNFTINKVDLNVIGIVFDYDFEFHITTSGQYTSGDLKLGNIDVQGDGDVNLEMVLNTLGHAKIFPQTTTPPEWVIAVLEYYGFLLVQPDFHITGIMHDEEISVAISKEISTLIEQYIGENAEIASQEFSPIIKDILNQLIQDPDSILQTIIILAMDHCPAAKFFVEMLHEEAVKQGYIKNV